MTAGVTILIAAAGDSSRMRGGDKLLERIDNTPQLRRIATAALAASNRVIVTLRTRDADRLACIAGLPVQILPVAKAALGMSASLRAAAEVTQGALMVLPADMPEITAGHLRSLIDKFDQRHILRACTPDGSPGHPVIFPADLLMDLRELTGDTGARSVLVRHANRVQFSVLPGQAAVTDLDTPEDWAAWRAVRPPTAP